MDFKIFKMLYIEPLSVYEGVLHFFISELNNLLNGMRIDDIGIQRMRERAPVIVERCWLYKDVIGEDIASKLKDVAEREWDKENAILFIFYLAIAIERLVERLERYLRNLRLHILAYNEDVIVADII